jgi:hypothetical protein
MVLGLRPLHPTLPDFAAEASGIDLRRPLDAAEIETAMDRFAVLVFRDQPLEEEQQLAFTRLFGATDGELPRCCCCSDSSEFICGRSRTSPWRRISSRRC